MQKLILLFASFLSIFTISVYAADAPANAFTLNTTAFLDQGALPVLYTCDGKDLSPEVDWTNVPAKTQSFALLLTDPEAPSGTFYHWVVYDIPASTTTFTEGLDKYPSGVMMGKNGFEKTQYNGPCPPKGAAHTYVFTLYALDSKLNLPAGADGKTVEAAIKAHTLGKVSLTAVYSRWLK